MHNDAYATITFDSCGRIAGLCGSAEGFQLMLIDPETLESRATMPTSMRDPSSGANPLSDLCGRAYFYLDHRDRGRLRPPPDVRRHERDPRGRLPDRADARLGRPDLVRHQGRPGRRGGPAQRKGPQHPARGGADRQLLGDRRDRRRLHRQRPRPRPLRRLPSRCPAGHLAPALRPRVSAEARPALAGLGDHAHAHRTRSRGDHRQRRPADAGGGLPAYRCAGAGPRGLPSGCVRQRRRRHREQPGGGRPHGPRGEQLRLPEPRDDDRRTLDHPRASPWSTSAAAAAGGCGSPT
jgi:hypothetical protein